MQNLYQYISKNGTKIQYKNAASSIRLAVTATASRRSSPRPATACGGEDVRDGAAEPGGRLRGPSPRAPAGQTGFANPEPLPSKPVPSLRNAASVFSPGEKPCWGRGAAEAFSPSLCGVFLSQSESVGAGRRPPRLQNRGGAQRFLVFYGHPRGLVQAGEGCVDQRHQPGRTEVSGCRAPPGVPARPPARRQRGAPAANAWRLLGGCWAGSPSAFAAPCSGPTAGELGLRRAAARSAGGPQTRGTVRRAAWGWGAPRARPSPAAFLEEEEGDRATAAGSRVSRSGFLLGLGRVVPVCTCASFARCE